MQKRVERLYGIRGRHRSWEETYRGYCFLCSSPTRTYMGAIQRTVDTDFIVHFLVSAVNVRLVQAATFQECLKSNILSSELERAYALTTRSTTYIALESVAT